MKTFGAWLKKRQGESSPVGDLADDFLADCQRLGVAPSTYKKPEDLRRRMSRLFAGQSAHSALNQAEREYLHQMTEEYSPITDVRLQFKQIFGMEEWRSFEFPPHTPILDIADRLQIPADKIATALRKGRDRICQYTIFRLV